MIIAGNVGTAAATKALAEAGADVVKVGLGPGAICTTRVVTGVGIPQWTAIHECATEADRHGVGVLADGGVRFSGDIAKAIGAGAHAVMIGGLFAGVEESPGETTMIGNRPMKRYRGMGSLSAMATRSYSKDRYSQETVVDPDKVVPEGVEGYVPFRGPLAGVVHQLVGGLRQAMGYCGTRTIAELRSKARFIRVSPEAHRESHPHDLSGVPTLRTTSRATPNRGSDRLEPERPDRRDEVGGIAPVDPGNVDEELDLVPVGIADVHAMGDRVVGGPGDLGPGRLDPGERGP